MADAGAAVEPAQALFTGRPAKANRRKQRPERQQREQADTDHPRHEGQRQPQPGPGHRQEQPDDSQQPREMRPGALPGNRISGPPQRLRQLQAGDGIALARGFRRAGWRRSIKSPGWRNITLTTGAAMRHPF